MADADSFVPIVDMMLDSFDVLSVSDRSIPDGNTEPPPIDIPF